MMNHGGGGGGGNGGGGDAERMLAQAEKLLLSGDLNGSKTYAIRACEADHSLVDHAELILAVADTLIAGESRIRGTTSDLPDWYAVLRLVRLTHNPELVATQYSRLAVLLNPSRNRFPYSEQAFRLISDAWYVLSDPSRKTLYDRELHLSQFGQLGQLGFQLFNQTPQSQSQSPQHHQQQSQSPQHPNQNQTMSFQNQQLPFQLHQPHFAQAVQTQSQSQQQQQQRSQFDQQLLQEQQQASWRQQFGQEQSSGSSSDWKRPVEEERLINLNNATERVQSSRRFSEPERPPSRSFEGSSHRTPSTDLTWASKPTPVSESVRQSEPVPWQYSEPARQYQSSSRSSEAAQLSLLPSVSVSPHASQPTRSNQSHAVSKPQPPPNTSKPMPVSQPPTTSKPLPVSQPPLVFQSTRPSQPPAASSSPSQLPPVFNSAQSFQPPTVSTTPSPVPAASTIPSPAAPAPVSQPTRVFNQTPTAEQTPKSGDARSDSEPEVPSFWTTCPYCYVLYEYPVIYEERVLKCQTKSCRRAYQAVKVPSPPVTEEDSYYCCWGFYPIGFSEVTKIPVSGLPKSAPKKPSPKVYYYDDEEEDDDSYIDSDPSEDDDDDDWLMNGTKRRKNVKQSKAKASTNQNVKK
ncbi:unnamed protein product [Arabidopsis arenosa]|uniref:J domain-containing protein n=1 Tax=Arabidopsis arenosa TaxID=38785 RepID=A0A8S1ZNZ9_ARAAE|nr:unnamed protein product [Arabidopsis arenosa]